MKYGYYPGCSLEKNASSYHVSAMAASKPFGVEFVELEDWNCCGATEYIALNKIGAYAFGPITSQRIGGSQPGSS